MKVSTIIPICWQSKRTEESVFGGPTPSHLNCHLLERGGITPRKRVTAQERHMSRDLHLSGGVIVIVCAVNSSSKYRVSVSDMTWGLNGGMSCGKRTIVRR